MTAMKLVTYNIHFGLGKDERYDLPASPMRFAAPTRSHCRKRFLMRSAKLYSFRFTQSAEA